ncbi:unnamed protein product [Pedinophyceae sp. YPF-701]|nr:unnamed protein product [Pedinophyceae sp. YPF-701]
MPAQETAWAPGGDAAGDAASLQDAFKRFALRRKQDRRAAEELRRRGESFRRSAEAKSELRRKFLERARRYLGVPYARRFHAAEGECSCEGCAESGRQLAQEPLFLDCCALVRRCVSDLKEEFGFQLGPGNQAFQWDTLRAHQVDSVDQLQPGDLIFYSGEYYSEKAKKQHFDMTHVEIFVGGATGEAVIGSREKHKWVKEYDSYKFDSKSWKLKEHFFCSIDAWLEGKCEPSGEIPWKWLVRGDGTRRSVFDCLSSQQQQQRASATESVTSTPRSSASGRSSASSRSGASEGKKRRKVKRKVKKSSAKADADKAEKAAGSRSSQGTPRVLSSSRGSSHGSQSSLQKPFRI